MALISFFLVVSAKIQEFCLYSQIEFNLAPYEKIKTLMVPKVER